MEIALIVSSEKAVKLAVMDFLKILFKFTLQVLKITYFEKSQLMDLMGAWPLQPFYAFPIIPNFALSNLFGQMDSLRSNTWQPYIRPSMISLIIR